MLNRWNFLKTGFYEGINLTTAPIAVMMPIRAAHAPVPVSVGAPGRAPGPTPEPRASLTGSGADRGWGFPLAPAKEGSALSGLSRRARSPSRGFGYDVQWVHCFVTHFRQINEQLLERLSKDSARPP